jgi:hypothetical protein
LPTQPPAAVSLPAVTINGIGTSYCFARGSAGTGGDALMCFVILYMPIVPLAAVHLFHEAVKSSPLLSAVTGFSTRTFRTIPMRWFCASIAFTGWPSPSRSDWRWRLG